MNSETVLSPMSPEAIERFNKEKKIRSKERGVCACGHSMNRHYRSDYDGSWSCTPAKSACSCGNGRTVLVTGNLRLFLYSTTGVGAEHALGKGIMACIENDVYFKWVVDGELSDACVCDICKQETGEPIPVAVDEFGGQTKPVTRSSRRNGVVCLSCYNKSWGQ